jgi:hypothetical protein
MIIDHALWMNSKSYELPVERIRAVIVERKSVIPSATVTALTAVVAVLAKYNAFWFLVNFTPENAGRVSVIGLLASIVCAIPTISRALFVNVSIAWDGEPAFFHVRFVPAYLGRRLARRFQELSSGS